MSDAGKASVACMPKNWSGQTPQIICSSTLLRARLSAMPLCETFGLELRADARFNEMDFGRWEGLNWGQIEREFPTDANRWSEDWVVQPAPGGESFTQVHHRCCEALHELLNVNPACPVILIVAHAGSIRAMICELIGKPLSSAFDIPLEYLHRCELHKDADDDWQLVASNIGCADSI